MELRQVFCEKIEWAEYPAEKWFTMKEDAVVWRKFPAAQEVVALERRMQKSKGVKLLDFLCCACTDAPDSGADVVDALQDMRQYYLVKEEEYLLVCVGKEELIAWALSKEEAEGKKIKAGKNVFHKTARVVKRPQEKE